MRQALAYFIGDTGKAIAVWISPRVPFSEPPQDAQVIYDGGEHAILYRRPDEAIILDYIPEAWRDKVLASDIIIVTEGRDRQLEYEAKMVRTGKIPEVKLTTVQA
jgi:hypothetical protein